MKEKSEERRRKLLKGSRMRAKEWRNRKRVERRALEAELALIASARAGGGV